MSDVLRIGDREFECRLFTGTGKFPTKKLIPKIISSSGSQMMTMALRRVDFDMPEENILEYIPKSVTLLPNTSGARDANEAVKIALIARETGCGEFIKIEVINDMKYLLPDNEETIKATKILSKEGFIVLPYINADPVVAKKLEDAGAAAVMPLGSPIGSNQGLKTKTMLEIIIENATIPVVVDAGIGSPSQAAEAMEMGADAVLVNSAIANAKEPESMAKAFSLAVKAGRLAYLSGIAKSSTLAKASSPLTGFLHD